VYEHVVEETGVAIKLEEEAMFDVNGNITKDETKMFGGCPSRYPTNQA
jgi:hypothetical protein